MPLHNRPSQDAAGMLANPRTRTGLESHAPDPQKVHLSVPRDKQILCRTQTTPDLVISHWQSPKLLLPRLLVKY